MAIHELNSTQYDTLETELKKELPYSICVFNHFILMRRGLTTEKTVFVDSWPDFSAVVIVDSKRKKALPYAVSFCKQPDLCYSLDTLLRHVSEVLAPRLFVIGCTGAVIDALVDNFKDAETCPIQNYSKGLAFTLPSDKIVPLEISNGFRISELHATQSHIENVYNAWEYSKHADLKCWIKYHISNFTTACVETEDGRPVAWQLQQEYGGLGMLYVEPEYRRAKLGSIVTRALARKLVEDGQLVFAFVADNNEASFQFHVKNGYILLPFKAATAFYNV